MGLLGDWLGSKRMNDPVRGTAQVVGASVVPENASSGACSLTLVVQADGVPPTPMERTVMAPADRWPRPGSTLPVTVDRADPEKLKVEWDEVLKTGDVAWDRAQAIAGGGSVGQITIDGGEVDDATRQRLAAMGLDADALVQQAQAVRQAQSGTQPADAGGDDLSEQLARLAQLHQSGLLSEDEFVAAKRRLLEAP